MSFGGEAAGFVEFFSTDEMSSGFFAAASISDEVMTTRLVTTSSLFPDVCVLGVDAFFFAATDVFCGFPEAFGLETAIAPTSCLLGFTAQCYAALQHNPRWNNPPTSRTVW
ncbi:hypothetical protein [Thalassospira lohafexi]|uniref:hypothetical protein n=1 Tax=Thalassospira lohafexi TaxID=744227 RepID=UPI0013FDB7A1|nr:hypothetical protein [Thalassospira lohafexi]